MLLPKNTIRWIKAGVVTRLNISEWFDEGLDITSNWGGIDSDIWAHLAGVGSILPVAAYITAISRSKEARPSNGRAYI